MRQSASAVSMPHVETRRFACAAASIDPLTSLEQYRADWQASQYQSWRSGETSAKQVMQHLGMGMMFEVGRYWSKQVMQ
jgi:hypothetical protein